MMSLFEEYQFFRKILTICPCFGELRRVSDLRLKPKTKAQVARIGDSGDISLE